MASNQTSHYGLNQWEAEDRVIREEFNGDNVKVDAALAGLAAQTAAKAAQTEVDGIKTQLAAKAAQSALDSLSGTVSTGLAKKFGTDNPYIKAGTYAGNGADTRTITLGFSPALVFVLAMHDMSSVSDSAMLLLFGDKTTQCSLTRSGVCTVKPGRMTITTTGFQVIDSSSPSPDFNTQGISYHYLALR